MCYDVVSATRSLIKYARHRRDEIAYIEALEKKLKQLEGTLVPHFHVSGFSHPGLLVFTNELPNDPQVYKWGLIPPWTKDSDAAVQIANQTLNARGETIFVKASFKNAAENRRCLVYLDAFYEHHHFKGKTYPYRIEMKDDSVLVLAGLWEEWTNKNTGEILRTVSIVTTTANPLMARIHNNPNAEGPRMPLILSRENQEQWLSPIHSISDKEKLQQLILPFPEEKLKSYTVARIKGKNAAPDTKEVEKEIVYPELNENSGQMNLFD